MTVADAAAEFGVTAQAVRDRCKKGLLAYKAVSSRKWLVDRGDVERYLSEHPGPRASSDAADRFRRVSEAPSATSRPPELPPLAAAQLSRLSAAVRKLEDRSEDSSLIATLEWQRDHYRAEAAAISAAALSVNAAAQELRTVVVSLVAALDAQSDALSQLLGPASPQDMTRTPSGRSD